MTSENDMMMGTDVCSSWILSLPRHESVDEELSVLPQHTKVTITWNNRTMSVLVGIQALRHPRRPTYAARHTSSCSHSAAQFLLQQRCCCVGCVLPLSVISSCSVIRVRR